MHDDRTLVERRLDRVLKERVLPAAYSERIPLRLSAWNVPDEPVPVAEALTATYEPFTLGSPWGRPWSTTWFRAEGEIPQDWAGRRVEAVFDLGFIGDWPGNQAEALVYDAAGVPIKAVNPQNQYVVPPAGSSAVDLLIEAAANPDILADEFKPTPLGDKLTAGDKPLYKFAGADLAVLDEEVWHLGLDLSVLRELMLELAVTDPRRHEILRALEKALDLLDADPVPVAAPAARAAVAAVLARPAHASAHTLSAIGHAHIDSAWLWPLRETIRKTSRTFSNVTALAQEYPDFIFACSQAQQYDWVKQHYPAVYQRIRDAVTAGQWIPVGGQWVEADGNLPGGEALARQLVHGKRFFLDEFGVETKGVWLPDSFGYNGAYPQLARLAGMEWFLTQKLSWNESNPLPHHTFWWEGIDGTRIFTHFPPIDTYNAAMTGDELAHAVRNFADKGKATRSLAPFGHGDGGGGPTREMMERARRFRDIEGAPRVVIEPPDQFFAQAQAEYPDAPVWSGELYLELHRATYTSQARTKAGNRRSEHLLREAELWAATATVRAGADYPYAELDRLWKTVLLHQFHDILPGSSIAWVHREAEATYARVAGELDALIGSAARALASEEGLVLLNTSPRPRREVAVVTDGPVPEQAQPLASGGWAVAVDVPASAAAAPVAGLFADTPVTAEHDSDGIVLDNGLVRIVVDEAGLIRSIRDHASGREALAPGAPGNLLQIHPDRPSQWDAWDVERHYAHQSTDLIEADEVTLTENGPLLAAIRVVRTHGESTITQTIRLTAGSRRVDIVTDADWHEREKFLKAAFPLDVHADRVAAEIQFGHVFRPTHTNTGWDAARFEVSGHRWIHAGEPGYGVALLTDSTYGHDSRRETRTKGGTTTTVRLSLLRAPRSPDPDADQGRHTFTYAIVPGADIAATVAEAYALNLPLRAVGGGEAVAPLVETSGDAIVVESVKLADDGSGDVVVRLYESLGARATGRLRPGFALAAAVRTDLLERPVDIEVETDGDEIMLGLRAFEVQTLRLRRG
ncbi:alpha-mannosidase [Actinoplanes derwentensis]|uniref:alpha-mannosidase n=1 Tax=Actinoplanes derwentensis TaxID=113562 RepID=A0A1H1SN58_9ACTN|nr:glycoside hydrolase family 38 C-terminal domain-containing protein [Actinoplanes derwentensis]GID83258.1 alpha-mannosidase [Actinoplanes derwentensis]SDS49278.1 alpha-mannosidase [Actinoplanes derwentensis]